VIVIHEIFGLSDWIRGVADQLAREGFIAVAPDLISGHGLNGGGTESAGSRDDVVKLIRGLTPEEVTTRLNAVRDYAIKLPAANGKTATVGFCWGGGKSFAYAASQPNLNAAVVYYGTSPEAADLAKIKAPVLGLYGGDDARGRHDPSGGSRNEEAQEDLRAAHLRGGRPRFPPGAGRPRRRQPQGTSGLAADRVVPGGSAQVATTSAA
jgi:dienelactone hydrolase